MLSRPPLDWSLACLILCQVLVCLYEPWFLENKNRKSEACRNDFLGDIDQVSATWLSKKLLKDFFVSQILRQRAIEIPSLFFHAFFLVLSRNGCMSHGVILTTVPRQHRKFNNETFHRIKYSGVLVLQTLYNCTRSLILKTPRVPKSLIVYNSLYNKTCGWL